MSKFFTIDSAVLVTLLRVANHAVPTRGVNPILQCIHLEVSNGQLIAHTTDMEVAFRQKTDQIGDCQDGIAVVDIAKLIAIASANKGDMVFSMGKQLKITCGKTKYDLALSDPDQFPLWESKNSNNVKKFKVLAEYLSGALNNTMFAVEQKDNARYSVKGVMFDVTESDRVNLVATDTRRLIVRNLNVEYTQTESDVDGQVVPLKACQLISACMSFYQGMVEVGIADNHISIVGDGLEIYSAVASGKFPPYKDLMKLTVKNNIVIDVDSIQMADCVRKASVMNNEDSRITFDFDGGLMTVSSQSEDGVSESEMVVPYDGKMGISFSVKYFTDFFRHCPKDIQLRMKDNKSSMVIHCDQIQYLMMPMGDNA